jgi:hypothetical protein
MPEAEIELQKMEAPAGIEKIPAGGNPEKELGPEQVGETAVKSAVERQPEKTSPAPAPAKIAPRAAVIPVVPKRVAQIDKILSEGLEDIYLGMDAKHQREFKLEGEAAAVKISDLMNGVKVKAQKILDVIRRWLGLIPGVNRFFLEQEAKIKTDRILHLK